MPTLHPSAPVHLLQDLAQRQADSRDLEMELPTPDRLCDVTPLPLSIPVLLRYGVIPLDVIDEAQRSEVESRINGPFDPVDPASTSGSSQTSTIIINLPETTLDHLAKLSVEASTSIKEACAAMDGEGEVGWKTRLTFRDLWRVFNVLEERMGKQAQGFELAPSA